MIIGAMNKYFSKHGRIIGLVIVVIISVTFVLFFGGMSVFDNFKGVKSTAINLLGRNVDMKDRQEEVKRIFLWASLHNPSVDLANANMPLNSNTIVMNMLQTYAAEDMGIIVGDKSVEEYIMTVPMFQTAGKYDSKKYETYVKDKLSPVYYKQLDLKEAVREMLQHQALRKTITESVIVPEEEIKEAYTNIYTKVDSKLLTYKSDDYSKKITLKDEEIQNYFNSNKAKYKTLPAAKGKLVLFSYEVCRKEATKKVSEKEILKYYEDNKFLYIKKEDPAKKKLKKDSKPAKPEFEPYEKVKDKIRIELADKKAKELAAEKAQIFADGVAVLTTDVFYDINDKVKAQQKCIEIFQKEASKENLVVKDSGWLYQGTDEVTGFGKEGKIVEAMASLFEDNPVSEPVEGVKGVYVAILEAKKGPADQSFDEVKDQVKKDLSNNKALLLAREDARNTALEISERLDKGGKFESVEKALKLKFEKLPPISAMMPLFMPEGSTIQELAFKTPQGKISKVETTRDGALILYVSKKIIPTDDEFNKQKGTFSMRYKSMKQSSAFQDYLSTLMEASTAASEK